MGYPTSNDENDANVGNVSLTNRSKRNGDIIIDDQHTPKKQCAQGLLTPNIAHKKQGSFVTPRNAQPKLNGGSGMSPSKPEMLELGTTNDDAGSLSSTLEESTPTQRNVQRESAVPNAALCHSGCQMPVRTRARTRDVTRAPLWCVPLCEMNALVYQGGYTGRRWGCRSRP